MKEQIFLNAEKMANRSGLDYPIRFIDYEWACKMPLVGFNPKISHFSVFRGKDDCCMFHYSVKLNPSFHSQDFG